MQSFEERLTANGEVLKSHNYTDDNGRKIEAFLIKHTNGVLFTLVKVDGKTVILD